jgi:hypothetical protein
VASPSVSSAGESSTVDLEFGVVMQVHRRSADAFRGRKCHVLLVGRSRGAKSTSLKVLEHPLDRQPPMRIFRGTLQPLRCFLEVSFSVPKQFYVPVHGYTGLDEEAKEGEARRSDEELKKLVIARVSKSRIWTPFCW